MRVGAALIVLFAAGALAGCDRINLAPPPADSAPPAPVAQIPDVRPFAGAAYAEFVARPEFQAYTPGGLGLTPDEQARLNNAMAVQRPAWIASGGGAHALLFTGCAVAGCEAGRAVVAIDLATGAAFAGVRDGAGVVDLAPNARLETLLRLSSPDRDWDDPQPSSDNTQPRP